MVKLEALRERLASFSVTLARLRALRDVGAEDDPARQWAIERGLQIAAQSVFDIGNHILSGGFDDRAAEYALVPGLLERHGVISAAVAGNLKGLAGFRNLLVHDYARVDPARVQGLLSARLDDLATFGSEVQAWLDRQGTPDDNP